MAAVAKRDEVGAQFVALQNRVIAETEQALAQYRGAIAERDEAQNSLRHLLDSRELSTKKAVEAGQMNRLDLSAVEVEKAVLMRAYLVALGKAQTALGALEDAVQRPLGDDSTNVIPLVGD